GAFEAVARGLPREVRRVAEATRGQRAARDPRVPPRPGDASARRARRTSATRARAYCRTRSRSRRQAGAEPRVEPIGAQAPPPLRRARTDARAALQRRPRP